MGILPEIFESRIVDDTGLRADVGLPAGPKEWAKLKKLKKSRRKTRKMAGRLWLKFNPNHDAKGRFASGGGGSDGTQQAVLSGPSFDNPISGLNPTESEQASVAAYTSSAYRNMNERMRDGVELTDSQKTIANDLNALIERSGVLDKPMTVYRGVRVENYLDGSDSHNKAASKFEKIIGQTIEMPGFQSSSMLPEPALSAALGKRDPGIVFQISTKRGANLHGTSSYDDEYEVLLGHNWKYKVTGVSRDKKIEHLTDDRDEIRRHIVHLEVVE